MKSLDVLTTPKQIDAWLLSKWQTPEFKQAHQNHHSFLKPVVKKFCEHPRFVMEMSDNKIERANFTPWFNLVTLREYENPYIHDLFLLHEIGHLISLEYELTDFDSWTKKMCDNEMLTSLFTEVEIYDYLPIRNKSFKEEIWWDRLPAQYNQEDLIKWRLAAIAQPKNKIEQVISHYGVNNLKWANIWKQNYLTVEKHMINFYKLSNKAEQVKIHLLWLNQNQTDNIVFKHEAEQFAPIYWGK